VRPERYIKPFLQGFCEFLLKLGLAVDRVREHLQASARIQTGTNCNENKSPPSTALQLDLQTSRATHFDQTQLLRQSPHFASARN